MLLSKLLEKRVALKIDINNDGLESRTEERMKTFIFDGASFILALLASDFTYAVSWRLSNRVNLKHNTYRRWFPTLYS